MGCDVRSPRWIAYLRLAVCLWMMVMGGIAARYSIVIKAHPLINGELLYPDSILRGHTLAATFGILGGIWSAVLFVPCSIILGESPPFVSRGTATVFMYSAFVDATMALGFSITAVVQSRYLPSPLGTCRLSVLHQMSQNSPTNKSWFEVFTEVDPYAKNVSMDRNIFALCTRETFLWGSAIGSAAFSGFASLLTLLCVVKARPQVSMLVATINPIGNLFCLRKVSKWIRYNNRRRQRAKRFGLSLINSYHDNTPELGLDPELGLRNITSSLPPSSNLAEVNLVKLLSIYGVAKSIASACHFADFVSLAMVSRRVRIATLASIHIKVLEQTTSCSSSPHSSPRVASSSASTSPILRKACWSCGAQICPDCASDHTLSYAAAFHMMNCYPNCSRCFRRYYCGKHSIWKVSDGLGGVPQYPGFQDQWKPQRCFGHGSRPGVGNAASDRRGCDFWDNPEITKEICTTCSYSTTDEREARRARREIAYCALRTVEGEGVQELRCNTCGRGIGEEGRRVWWGCKLCSLECAEDFHG